MEILKTIEMKIPNPYKVIIVGLLATALVSAAPFGYDVVIISLLLSVIVAQVVDVSITYLKTKKLIYADSATIAALILANIIVPGQYLILGSACALAMILKHAIRFEKKPVFNPASLALFVLPLVFLVAGMSNPIATYLGWSNGMLSNVPSTIVLLVFGLLVSIKIRRFAASLSYLVAYVAMTLMTSGTAGLVYFPLFGAFFMITEPRTSPTKTTHQIIFGITPWVLGMVYMMAGLAVFDAFSLSFLSANLIKIGLEKSKI